MIVSKSTSNKKLYLKPYQRNDNKTGDVRWKE